MIEPQPPAQVPAPLTWRALELLDAAVVVVDATGIVAGAVGGLGARHPLPFTGDTVQPWLERLGALSGVRLLHRQVHDRGGSSYTLTGPDGLARQYRAEAFPLLDRWAVPGVEGWWLLVVRDTTVELAATSAVEHSRRHDPVTGLPNRQFFAELVEAALERRRGDARLAVVVLDLDRFGTVAGSIGSRAADVVIRDVADRLRAELAGAAVGRLDGDEFAVVLDEVASVDEALRLAEAVRSALRSPFSVAGRRLTITASAGVATVASPGVTAGDVLRDAAIALATAKRQGRDRTEVTDAADRDDDVDRRAAERVLRRALADGGLRAHFQAIVDARTGALVGLEGLVRIADPDLGMLTPAAFLAAAEESSLVVELDTWMLHECCRWARRWADRFGERAPTVACNVSAALLAQGRTAELVREARRDHDVPPNLLALETTEATLLEAGPGVWETLARIRATGVHLGLDDFGTGLSSLTRLRDFPITYVKVAQSFVRGIGTRKGDRELVEAVVRVARAVGLHVVAEGVEQQGQRDTLVALGCTRLQGHLVARPLPPDDVTAWLEEAVQRSTPPSARTEAAVVVPFPLPAVQGAVFDGP